MYTMRCRLFLFIVTAFPACAQDADSVLNRASIAIITSQDSLSIFGLIDSLLSLEPTSGSQLVLRLGYNSNVLSAGRTLGIQNFGLAPGISYYHSSGLYADVSGYWSKDFEPSYYLTVASGGYMHDFSNRFSIMASYDHYFYSLAGGNSYVPYKNTLSFTPIVELKPISFTANYAFYFGDQTAHRIMPGLSITLKKKKFWKLDHVTITPSVFVLWGNETITTLEIVLPKTLQERRNNRLQYGTPYSIVQVNKNVFGLMNYAISIPVNINYKRFGVNFTYTYHIPKALPGEPLTLSESTYLSGSLLYFLDLSPRKSSL
jgi:hypothetical protein